METYDEGDLVRVTGTFTNAAGTAVDPAAVTAYCRNPSRVVTTFVYGTDVEVVRSATGVYYMDINANEPGLWRYGFRSTGSGQGADEHRFYVEGSSFF
jgi:hypothetical protein